MQQRIKLLEKISITQRQALLTTLALYFLGTMALIAIKFSAQAHNSVILFSTGFIGVLLFGGAWFLYYKYNWEPIRYFAAATTTLLVALFLPEPFVSSYAPMAITIPVVLSLVVGGAIPLIVNSVLLIAILLVRAGGSGVYAHPATLTIFAMIVGGLLIRRLIEASSFHQLKQAQESVKQSERQMRALVASLDDIIFQFDEQGTYLNVWTADESLLFLPKDRLLGKRITEVLGEEGGRQFEDAVRRVVSSGQPENMEYSLEVIGGRRWFNARINTVHDPGARPTVCMLIRDITGQKQMEQAYASGQKRFQSLIEHAPDGIALLGQEGVLKQVTPSAENILGYGPADAEGQDPALLTHPEDLPALLALLGDLIQTPGKVARTEYRFRHKDGSWRWLDSTISNLLMEPGVEAIVFNYRDITERKRAEAVLQASEERYRLLFEENPLPLWVYDTGSLRFLAVNDAAVAHYGYERGEFLQMTIREIRPPEELPRLEAYLSRPRPAKERSGPWKYRKKDGILIDVEVVSNETIYLGKPARLVLSNDITEQLQAKAALATSELRFRSLIENSADGITVVDDQGTVTYVSPSIERLLGYTQAEAVGRQAMDYVHREDRLRLLEHVARLNQAGADHPVVQYRFKHNDGSWHWLESTLAHQADEGMGQGIVFNYRDVTGRKQAEKELETVYGQLRNLFDNLDEAFFSMDTDQWTVLQMSPACEKIYGRPASAFFEDPVLWRRFIHPDDLHIIDANFPKLYTGESVLQSYRIQRPDGEVRWVEVRLKPTLDLQGTLLRVDGILSDITGRRQAEQEIESLANFPRENISPVLRFARDGTLLYANPASRDLLETWACEIGGHPPAQIQLLIDKTLAISMSQAMEIAQGSTIYNMLFVPLVDKDYVNVYSSDITQRRQVEEELRLLNLELEKRVAERTMELNVTNAELEHANRAKDEFLANMSHELRTPLNSILGLSESLLEQRRGPLNERQQHSLRVIESSGVHLLDLINDILDLSKIEAGKFDFYPETIRVEDMVQSSLSFVKSQAMKKAIKLLYEADPAISTIHADPRRLKQILVNLLTNAVKFTPDQGQVTLQVRANTSQNLVQFSVIDTGIGIAAEDLARLFRPFEQVDSQLNRQFEGSGLGLVLVQKLTDLHGGSVHVQSDGVPGKGSCFTVNLPWEKEREPEPGQNGPDKNVLMQEPSVSAEKSVDAITVLLAEDHVANILTIGEYLESYGYQVVVAHNGAEALEKAQEADPALILMDIQMPVIDGLEVTRRLRAEPRFARTPIIALTALAMPGDRERCLQAGANEYMSKPVSLKSLVKTIHELVLQFPPEKHA